jgi:hypothetical protein
MADETPAAGCKPAASSYFFVLYIRVSRGHDPSDEV